MRQGAEKPGAFRPLATCSWWPTTWVGSEVQLPAEIHHLGHVLENSLGREALRHSR